MCDHILVILLKMEPHYSQSNRENATPSSGTSPLASYKKVTPPPFRGSGALGQVHAGQDIQKTMDHPHGHGLEVL